MLIAKNGKSVHPPVVPPISAPTNAASMNHKATPSPPTPSRIWVSDSAPKPDPPVKFSKVDVPQFLSLGHAHLCWCREHPVPASPTALPSIQRDHEIGTEAHDPGANFERIEPEESDEDGWTVLLPEARFGKLVGPAVLAEACKPKNACKGLESKGRKVAKDRGGYGVTIRREEGTPMLKCEKCKQCACPCEWPSLQEAAELKSKNGPGMSKNAQGAKKKAA